jgi:hypothetical protein
MFQTLLSAAIHGGAPSGRRVADLFASRHRSYGGSASDTGVGVATDWTRLFESASMAGYKFVVAEGIDSDPLLEIFL